MKRYFLPVFIVLVICLFSCYYDNEEALYPAYNTVCDSTNVTFSRTIAPMLNNNCTGCHNGAPGGAFPLTTYAEVKAKVTLITASINYTGKSPMPADGKLKACLINQFAIWVRNQMPL